MNSEDTARQVAALREELRELVASGRLQVEPAEPGRVRNAEVLRGLLAALTRTGGEHSTVRISRNARGDTQFEVSVRTGDTAAIASAADAAAEATRLYDNLRELYPLQAGPERA